jgi:hypothetical protein
MEDLHQEKIPSLPELISQDEKHSTSSNQSPTSGSQEVIYESSEKYPSPLVRWAIVIALLLGEFLARILPVSKVLSNGIIDSSGLG